ncbi:MAG TPA: ATP-binding protein [Terriglobales bacterium]|nr:ATP-binding protein [Terriglobales bacterium]
MPIKSTRPPDEAKREEDSFPIQSFERVSVGQILESAPDAMLLIGEAGVIVYLNALAAELFGYRRNELLGQTVEQLVPPEARTLHRDHRRKYMAHPRRRMMETGLELYGLRKDHTRFPLEISLSPLRTSGGDLVLGAVRDRTKKQKAEAEIRNLNQNLCVKVEELDAANREMQEFTYTTAHDLRAPVRHIQGYAELLIESAGNGLEPSDKRNLDKIAESAKRLGMLIDDLLDFSRIGRASLHPSPVNLPLMIAEIHGVLQAKFANRKVTWKVGDLPAIIADPGMLRMVFTNLLDNALKFTQGRDEATIEIGCIVRDGDRVIFVRDNGVGFEMRYVTKLFHVFQRLHRHEEFEGTGIGLAIVRRIIERHGGRVWAEGVRDAGATFYVSLPEGETTHDKQHPSDLTSGG